MATQLTKLSEIAIYRAQFWMGRFAVPVAMAANRGRVVRFAHELPAASGEVRR
jgi:hypothetical protein